MGVEDRDVLITGIGPVTSIGVGVEELWRSLLEGRTGACIRSLPLDVGVSIELPVATIPTNAEPPRVRRHREYLANQDCAGARDLTYALLAIELALEDSQLEYDHSQNRIGMVQVFEAPAVEDAVAKILAMFDGPPPTDRPPALYDMLAPSFYNMQPFVYVHLASKAFGFHGFCTSVHNACSSGAFAIETAASLIRDGMADVIVVVGGEAFETGVRLEWFRRLGLYAKEPRMLPFAAEPTGFFVGEGASALVLESTAHATARKAPIHARYAGGAVAHQGWKQTIPDLRAKRLRSTIDLALARAGINNAEIDLIVPHGAATAISDEYETMCLRESLGDKTERKPATVFKPYFGHMLAACSIIEVAAALLCMKHGTIPPLPWGFGAGSSLPFEMNSERTQRNIHSILKIATGFTGHDAALVFKRV